MKLAFPSADVVCHQRPLKDVCVASHCALADVVGDRSSYGDRLQAAEENKPPSSTFTQASFLWHI